MHDETAEQAREKLAPIFPDIDTYSDTTVLALAAKMRADNTISGWDMILNTLRAENVALWAENAELRKVVDVHEAETGEERERLLTETTGMTRDECDSLG